MANIVETDNWPSGIYQYADGDVLEGGPNSSEVLPIKQLAQRALYQRLRNVTDWDAALSGEVGYPSGAVVRSGGVSWRAKVANTVAPGSDPEKWERWGHSESELDAKLGALLPYGVPVVCPNAGPAASSDKTKVHKSALGEYWMWIGDMWAVVAGAYSLRSTYTFPCGLNSSFYKQTAAPRAGRVLCTATASYLCAATNDSSIVAVMKGTTTQATDHAQANNVAGWLTSGSSSAIFDVAAGDLLGARFQVTGSVGGDRSINLTVDYCYMP